MSKKCLAVPLDNAASASEALLGVDAGEADADAALSLAVDLGVAADGVGARAIEAGGDGGGEEGDDDEDGAHFGGFLLCEVEGSLDGCGRRLS